MADTKKTVIFLSAILLALVVVSAAIIFLIPSFGQEEVEPEPTPSTSPAANASIDTSVFSRQEYTKLDTSLIQQGALPVKPPAVVGKPNPFF